MALTRVLSAPFSKKDRLEEKMAAMEARNAELRKAGAVVDEASATSPQSLEMGVTVSDDDSTRRMVSEGSTHSASSVSSPSRFRRVARMVLLENSIVSHWRGTNTTPVKPLKTAKEGAVSGLKSRRASMPALKVSCVAGVQLPLKKESRRCSFSDETPETYEAFTPYGKKYGAAPSDFNLDADGKMVLLASEKESSGFECKPGDTIESTVDNDVMYRDKPIAFADVMKGAVVGLGEQVVVIERKGTWVKDSIGWINLLQDGQPGFTVVTPKHLLRFATPRCPIMQVSPVPSPNPSPRPDSD